jgi:predicted transglutaminase-like cysteine proteinase
MNIRDAVSFVGKRFQYMKDPKIYIADLWYIMKKSDVMVGDCEDFALTSI